MAGLTNVLKSESINKSLLVFISEHDQLVFLSYFLNSQKKERKKRKRKHEVWFQWT